MFNGMTDYISFQATVSATTSGIGPEVYPHHPITCQTQLRLNEDMTMECDHAKTIPDHPRTQAAIIHSIACLIIEEAIKRY